MVRFFLLLAATCSLHAIAALSPLPAGKSQFEFVDAKGDPARPVTVWMYVPDGCDNACPLQFVMHGVKRNGEEYLDNWIEFAEARKFIVVAPEFTRKYFPRDADYSLGRSTRESDPAKWAFAVPEHLFDELKKRYALTTGTYRLFGHSAGGQFVHRMHLFNPRHHADPIIAANPGWFTVPEWGVDKTAYRFPHSTIGSRVDATRAAESLSRPFLLMLGREDTDANDPSLNKSAGANEQGRYRLARGEYFFTAATLAAKRLSATFQWQKIYVDGVGHNGTRMAAAAIDHMYASPLANPATAPGAKPVKQ